MPVAGPLKVKTQVFCDAEIALGPGKADILEAIDRTGSISAAGREIGMSYRRTWLLVDTMNRCWREPLIAASPGGGARSGARLTDCGRAVLDAFRGLENRLMTAAQSGEMQTLAQLLRDRPLGSQGE
jgi:molybdate transport system regulatory protein